MLKEPVKLAVIGCDGYAHQLIIRVQTTPFHGKITAATALSLDSDGTVEFRDSYRENRLEMIEHLCRTMRSDEPLIGSLETTRPFTLAVNAAFESVGTIHTIPEDALDGLMVGENEKQVAISGIETIIEQAYQANALFSEIGVPWARASEPFNTEGYTRFPVRFKAEETTGKLVSS